jgi:multiple sugar transport system ATP-binding protein
MADVVLRGVRKAFGDVEVMRNVDLEIASGEFVVFVGPSGCGKSTLLRMIAGLEDITEGECFIGGQLVNDVPPSERGIAMVFQSYALYPHMNLYDNMAFGMKLAGANKQEIDVAVKNAAKILHIENLLDRKPKALSGGQRQRVAIGRAITRKPKVFLFDEPLSNLDAALRVKMRVEFAKLHEELKTTMVYVTHDQVEAMTLADRIVVLSAGNVEQVGTPLDLYHHPRNLFVAGFIGSPKMNFISGEISEQSATSATVLLPSGARIKAAVDASNAKAGDKVTLGIRPEHATDGAADGNFVEATVMLVEPMGEATYVYLVTSGSTDGLIVRMAAEVGYVMGDVIRIGVGEKNCHLFDAKGIAFKRLAAAPTALAA